jgi:hypothetical protein
MDCRFCQRPDAPARLNPFYEGSGEGQPIMVRMCEPCATESCPECGGTVYTCVCDPDVPPFEEPLG